eukprot:IDg22054t1
MGAAGHDRPWHNPADHTGEAGPSTRARTSSNNNARPPKAEKEHESSTKKSTAAKENIQVLNPAEEGTQAVYIKVDLEDPVVHEEDPLPFFDGKGNEGVLLHDEKLFR